MSASLYILYTNLNSQFNYNKTWCFLKNREKSTVMGYGSPIIKVEEVLVLKKVLKSSARSSL